MGSSCIVSSIGYASSCCSKIKSRSMSLFRRDKAQFNSLKQEIIDMRDDEHHSSIMSKEEINWMIEKHQQTASTILNEYKLIKSNPSIGEDDDQGDVSQIKQEVNTIEFEDNDHLSKDSNNSIEALKKEILMNSPTEDDDN